MKLANIVPDHALWLIPSQTYHLELAPHLLSNVKRKLWLRSRHERGDFIILDNGASEVFSGEIKEMPAFHEIVSLANEIGADEVCLPDKLGDWGATGYLHLTHAPEVEPRRRMVIPQGENPAEWLSCLHKWISGGLEFRSVGVPKWLERFPNGRQAVLNKVLTYTDWWRKYDFHLLGVWRDPRELLLGREFPWLRGCDTGAAMAWAQAGAPIDLPIPDKHFSLQWGADVPFNDRFAEHNMVTLREWARGH